MQRIKILKLLNIILIVLICSSFFSPVLAFEVSETSDTKIKLTEEERAIIERAAYAFDLYYDEKWVSDIKEIIEYVRYGTTEETLRNAIFTTFSKMSSDVIISYVTGESNDFEIICEQIYRFDTVGLISIDNYIEKFTVDIVEDVNKWKYKVYGCYLTESEHAYVLNTAWFGLKTLVKNDLQKLYDKYNPTLKSVYEKTYLNFLSENINLKSQEYYNFNVMHNTYLTASYPTPPEEKTNDAYNWELAGYHIGYNIGYIHVFAEGNGNTHWLPERNNHMFDEIKKTVGENINWYLKGFYDGLEYGENDASEDIKIKYMKKICDLLEKDTDGFAQRWGLWASIIYHSIALLKIVVTCIKFCEGNYADTIVDMFDQLPVGEGLILANCVESVEINMALKDITAIDK